MNQYSYELPEKHWDDVHPENLQNILFYTKIEIANPNWDVVTLK